MRVALRRLQHLAAQGIPYGHLLVDSDPYGNAVDEQTHYVAHVLSGLVPSGDDLGEDGILAVVILAEQDAQCKLNHHTRCHLLLLAQCMQARRFVGG